MTQLQVATNQGFHIDQVMNGIAVVAWRNQPNHSDYTLKIFKKMDDFINRSPNAIPTQCYYEILEILDDAKQAIINNPGVHLNKLDF